MPARKPTRYHVIDKNGVVQPGGPYATKEDAKVALEKRLARDLATGADVELSIWGEVK